MDLNETVCFCGDVTVGDSRRKQYMKKDAEAKASASFYSLSSLKSKSCFVATPKASESLKSTSNDGLAIPRSIALTYVRSISASSASRICDQRFFLR